MFGVKVIEGSLHLNTPICVSTKEDLYLGRVTSIEADHKAKESIKCGEEACVKIESDSDTTYLYGRHFSFKDELVSKVSH